MGWKLSTVIIKDAASFDSEGALTKLGFSNLKKIEDDPFEAVLNPPDNHVYVGRFNNCLLICAPDLPLQLIEDDGEKPQLINNVFPGREVCSLVLHSVVNLWAFAVIRNGKRVRTKAGSSDNGTFIDQGEPLEEELPLLNTSFLNEDGERVYPSEYDDEPMTEDQVGEEFVFALSKRYLKKEIVSNDELMDTVLSGYTYQSAILSEQPIRERPKFGWRSIIIVLILIILWQTVTRC